MKILEPIPRGDIPGPALRAGHFDALRFQEVYKQAAGLNGLVLPIQFQTRGEALQFGITCRHERGTAVQLGLRAAVRGNTVYLYKS